MAIGKNRSFPKRPRLKDFDYTGTYGYFITIRTKDHSVFFKEEEVVKGVLKILKETARSKKFTVMAYCFMPDHLHLLVTGVDDNANLKNFISVFKQKSGYWFKSNYSKNLWHTSYYDHVLRKEESVVNISHCILENPVRKGLVSNFGEYPFSNAFIQV